MDLPAVLRRLLREGGGIVRTVAHGLDLAAGRLDLGQDGRDVGRDALGVAVTQGRVPLATVVDRRGQLLRRPGDLAVPQSGQLALGLTSHRLQGRTVPIGELDRKSVV